MHKKLLAIIFFACLITSLPIYAKEGPAGSSTSAGSATGSSGTGTPVVSSSSGGGHRVQEIDSFSRQLESWKKQYPEKFENLKKLLYIEPFTTEKYNVPAVQIYYSGNRTLNRTDELEVAAYVINQNPIEIRRALYLTLEEKDPSSKNFKQVSSSPMIVQTNEYGEKSNDTIRLIPDLTSFRNLKQIGKVTLRIKATDGQYNWYSSNTTFNTPHFYGDLVLDVKNNPPLLRNITLMGPNPARYNDPLEYVSVADDPNEDTVNVTLHILEESGIEKKNESQEAKSGDQVVFKASRYGFFGENDAGKNFTYYYTYGDGINISNTSIFSGPNLKRSPKIWVANPRVVGEDENWYWWQRYNFYLDIANQEREDYDVSVTLFTNTPAYPWRNVETKTVRLSKETQTISFDAAPFDVLDCNQSFSYRFKFSEYDQNGKDMIEANGFKHINPRIVKYDLASLPIGFNIVLILLTSLLIGIFIERRFYK
jgi:hypothetical protein